MQQTFWQKRLRDVAAVLVVGIFMFPLFWWALTSFKPTSAIFDKDRDRLASTSCRRSVNYAVTMLGKSRAELAIESGNTFGVGGASSYDSRQTIIDLAADCGRRDRADLLLAVLAAYALSRMRFRRRQAYLELDTVAALHAADRDHRAGRASCSTTCRCSTPGSG